MLWRLVLRLCREDGQDLTEYGLLIGLVVLLGVVSITLMGTSIEEILSRISSAVDHIM